MFKDNKVKNDLVTQIMLSKEKNKSKYNNYKLNKKSKIFFGKVLIDIKE